MTFCIDPTKKSITWTTSNSHDTMSEPRLRWLLLNTVCRCNSVGIWYEAGVVHKIWQTLGNDAPQVANCTHPLRRYVYH